MHKIFVPDPFGHLFRLLPVPVHGPVLAIAQQLTANVFRHPDLVRSVDDSIAPEDLAEVFTLVDQRPILRQAELQRVILVRQLRVGAGHLDRFHVNFLPLPELDRSHPGHVETLHYTAL